MIEIGKWYYANYGHNTVLGRCVGLGNGIVLKFRWGIPFRESHFVEKRYIISECQDPRCLIRIWKTSSNLFRIILDALESLRRPKKRTSKTLSQSSRYRFIQTKQIPRLTESIEIL